MNLIDVYEIAIASKSYNEFKSVIDYHENDTPLTVISSNEFKLITVDLGSVSGKRWLVDYEDWDGLTHHVVVDGETEKEAKEAFKIDYPLDIIQIREICYR